MRVSSVIFLGLVGLWTVQTAQRLPAFASDLALWTEASERVPGLARVHLNRCVALTQAGDLAAAWTACQTATGLTFNPQRPGIRQGIERAHADAAQALILAEQGYPDRGRQMLEQVAAQWPDLDVLPAYRAALEPK